MKNKILKVEVTTLNPQSTVIIYRRNRPVRVVRDDRYIRMLLDALNNGAYTTYAGYGSMPDKNGVRHTCVLSVTYRPMQFFEAGYREVLRYIFQWLSANVDGTLEDDDNADRYWHILGAMFEDGPYWAREDHKRALFEIADGWDVFFTTKGR
jgi:hypothetical protein